MLKKLLENGGLFFTHEWECDGKEFKAEFDIQVIEGDEKEVHITIDQINNYTNYLNEIAICLFSEEYNLDETEQFMLDLETQHLEFIINKLEEIF